MTAPQPRQTLIPLPASPGPFRNLYRDAESDRERRRILLEFNAPITVLPGVRGGRHDPMDRFVWEQWEAFFSYG